MRRPGCIVIFALTLMVLGLAAFNAGEICGALMAVSFGLFVAVVGLTRSFFGR